MKLVSLTLLVLGLALAAATVTAQTGNTSVTLAGHTDGAGNYWTSPQGTGNNPTINVPASTAITVTASAATGTHNLKIGDGTASAVFGEGDPAITATFTSPASGDVTYICAIHGSGMSGKFHVAGATDTTTSSTPAATKGTPGFAVFGVAIAVVGAALLLRRK